MFPEAELILAIAKEVVYGKGEPALSLIKKGNINWQSFKDMLSYHGLAVFAYASLKNNFSLLPPDLVKSLEATYNYYLMHTAYLEQKFLDLAAVFEEKNITLVPIKGMALLEDLYADYPLRPSTDIDVLVAKNDLEKAVEILEEQGFTKELGGLKESYWRQKQYHLIFSKKEPGSFNLIIELHWDLDYPRQKYSLLPEMWSRLRSLTVHDRTIKTLSVEDTFFSLALHLRHFGNILCLRDACDIARLLNKYARSFDWEYVLGQSKKSAVCSTVYFALCQANFFLRIDIPADLGKRLGLPAWKRKIIRYFIEKNTFLLNQSAQGKNLYLKAHFLLYDNFWEPISYILNIPLEQFAKFYGLNSYAKRTKFLYQWRFLYMPTRYVGKILKGKPNGIA